MLLKPTFATALTLATLALGRVIDTTSSSTKSLPEPIKEPKTYNASFGGADPPTFPGLEIEVAGLDFDITKYANDEMWKKYSQVKGDHLLCLMHATDKGAGFLLEDKRQPPSAASKWKGSEEEMATWYWIEGDADKGWEADFERMGLKTAFNGLGLDARPAFEDDGSPADGHNDFFNINHYDDEAYVDPNSEWPLMKNVMLQKYKVGGKEYMATGGVYHFAINKNDGAIIAKYLMNPATGVVEDYNWNRKASPDELPELRYGSDIYWAIWNRNNPNAKKIRVYGAYHVVNDDTILLLSRAFKNKEVKNLSVWPGTSFDAHSEEGKALIGSPIGATIAHMLIGHKAELGIKRISKITVVTEESRRARFGEKKQEWPNLFFEIEDVPADKITPDEPEEEKPGDKKPGGQKREFEQRIEPSFKGNFRHVRNKGKVILEETGLEYSYGQEQHSPRRKVLK